MYRTTRRFGLQSTIFATNPWALMRASVKARCAVARRPEALATLEQAEQFFRAGAEAERWSAKPLLLYYAFMNLAKSLALTTGTASTFDQAHHGVSEQLKAGKKELVDAYLRVFPSPDQKGRPNVFAEFFKAVAGVSLGEQTDYELMHLLPQVVTGHRIWSDASDKNERFVALKDVQIMQHQATKILWLRLELFADDLTRLGVGHDQLLLEGQLSGQWREVVGENDALNDRYILRFEQRTPIPYAGRAGDMVPTLVGTLRKALWVTVASVPPYRKYYLYLAPKNEHPYVLPQLLSIYAITFYLGSITRYRPQQFDAIIEGHYGEQIQEILTNQPNQFLYLIASEFAQREVTRAAIV